MPYKSPVPSSPEYLLTLGQAAYSYCYMEWTAIYVIKKLDPTFEIATTHEMTGGKIGRALKRAVKIKLPGHPEDVGKRLIAAYREFFSAVEVRSDLLHAHPFTAAGGHQRLGRYKAGLNYEWGRADIDAACEKFDKLNAELNDLYYRHLA